MTINQVVGIIYTVIGVKTMKKRIYDLIIKLLSIKGLFFIICAILAFMGKIEGQYIFYAGLIVIGDRSFEKWLSKK